MKYIHAYQDGGYCESESFKDTPNTLVLTDEQYDQIGKLFDIVNGVLVVKQ